MNKISSSKKLKKDVIVSVRLPKSLVEELKDIQQINHFMDLSDEIRFVVRRYCLGVMNLSSNNSNQTAQPPIEILLEQKRNEKLISDLNKIIETLKNNKKDNSNLANTSNTKTGLNE
ncbi:MAG: hypothetical protein ACP5N1_04115 [Candidatus Woesearchaeota archaeon]